MFVISGLLFNAGYSTVLKILPSLEPLTNPYALPDAPCAYLSDNFFHTFAACSVVNALSFENRCKSSKYFPPSVISKVVLLFYLAKASANALLPGPE